MSENNGSTIAKRTAPVEVSRGSGEIPYRETLKSLGACESTLQKMQAIDKLHDVSLKAMEEIHHTVDSSINDELKMKCLTVLHLISQNASQFEKIVSGEKKVSV